MIHDAVCSSRSQQHNIERWGGEDGNWISKKKKEKKNWTMYVIFPLTTMITSSLLGGWSPNSDWAPLYLRADRHFQPPASQNYHSICKQKSVYIPWLLAWNSSLSKYFDHKFQIKFAGLGDLNHLDLNHGFKSRFKSTDFVYKNQWLKSIFFIFL